MFGDLLPLRFGVDDDEPKLLQALLIQVHFPHSHFSLFHFCEYYFIITHLLGYCFCIHPECVRRVRWNGNTHTDVGHKSSNGANEKIMGFRLNYLHNFTIFLFVFFLPFRWCCCCWATHTHTVAFLLYVLLLVMSSSFIAFYSFVFGLSCCHSVNPNKLKCVLLAVLCRSHSRMPSANNSQNYFNSFLRIKHHC